MKIAFVKQKYIPFGGGEAYLAGLLDGCAGKGHEVHVLTSTWNNDQKFPFQMHEARICKRSRRSRLYSFAASVAEIVDKYSFDVVFSLERTVSQDIWRAGDCVYPKWLTQRALYESSLTTFINRAIPGHRAAVEIERKCVEKTSIIIANSEMIRRDLIDTYGETAGRVEVIHNGYDPARFSLIGRPENRVETRRELGFSGFDQVLLFVASGWRRKGLLELMQALQGLPDLKLVVLGRDEVAPWKKIAKKFCIDEQVKFHEPRNDIHRFYHAADLTVLPSWYDSFGFVVLESMACGTPVVVSRFAGAHELVNSGLNGFVINRPDEIEEMRSAIVESLKVSSFDCVAESVSEYTVEENLKKTLEVIERAAA